MKRATGLAVLIFLASICLPQAALPATWHYDFNPGEDLSALTVVNPTGNPSLSLSASPGTLQMNVPGNTQYDLCTWVNLNALRLYHTGGGEPFTLETRLQTSATSHTFMSGLYLYSADGAYGNDLVYGVNPTHVKIDLGTGVASGYGTAPWTAVGPHDWLYMQVAHDGSLNYDFSYKTAADDAWTPYATISGFSFDRVGMITKTWYYPPPAVTANFDYLYYNYTPSQVIPEPSAVAIWAMLGGLGIAIGWWRRGRRRP